MAPGITLGELLKRASAALQQGRVEQALAALRAVPRQAARQPDYLHLLGLAHKAAGDPEAAERCLTEALSVRPDQPAVLGNLGNVLQQLGRTGDAESAYRRALDLDPGFADARRNLAVLLAATDRDREAVTHLDEALATRPRDVGAWTVRGQCLRRLGEFDASVASFRQALALQPDHANALAGLGQTLRMMGRPAAAARAFDAALRDQAASIDLQLARADVAADEGRYDEAERRYRAILAQAPTHVATHVQLSELLWQTGAASSYGESFREALASHPDSPELLRAWCDGLVGTGAAGTALEALQSRPGLVAGHPQLLQALAKRQAAAGDTAAALRSFQQALAGHPESPELNLDFAQFAIYREDYDAALAALQVTERHDPENQLLWACRGLCWRLLGDPRADWLNDHARFVATYEIDCPPGFGTLPNFLAALEETLDGLHRTQAAPAQQSLRGGTQTAARLFYREDPVIQALRASLGAVVTRYVRDLPEDDAHPLLRRRSQRWQFSGSWSVRLRSGGYHVNHVHPQGWISSSHYVTVPAEIGASAQDPAGWLKFGESGLGLGDREQISRLVRPEPGHLTLFPSYFWHGTVPFQAEESRLTTPFDVVPVC